jgi:ABC-type branched-subunit amino acid transport system substrate-binding protein
MQRRFAVPFLLTISLLLSSCCPPTYKCIDPLGCVEISSGGQVFIGALLTVYGSQGETGRQAVDEIKTAIQKNGLVLGHEIKLIWQGSDCSENYARLSATLLTGTPDILGIIGPSCATDTRVALPILEDAGLPLLPPSPTAVQAFQHLVIAINKSAILQPNGALVIPRSTLQQAIQALP